MGPGLSLRKSYFVARRLFQTSKQIKARKYQNHKGHNEHERSQTDETGAPVDCVLVVEADVIGASVFTLFNEAFLARVQSAHHAAAPVVFAAEHGAAHKLGRVRTVLVVALGERLRHYRPEFSPHNLHLSLHHWGLTHHLGCHHLGCRRLGCHHLRCHHLRLAHHWGLIRHILLLGVGHLRLVLLRHGLSMGELRCHVVLLHRYLSVVVAIWRALTHLLLLIRVAHDDRRTNSGHLVLASILRFLIHAVLPQT